MAIGGRNVPPNRADTERAPEALYCHPHTMRYQVRRLQERTGRSLSDPHGLAELAAGVCTLR